MWQDALRVIQGGMAGEEARQVVEVTRSVVESWFVLAQKARGLWEHVAVAAGALPEMMGELQIAEKETAEVRSAIERMQSFLNRPKPPIDAARLEKGAQAVAEGRYKTAEQIRASRRGHRG